MRALILDDSPEDAELLVRELRRSGLEMDWRHASTRDEYIALLDWLPDVVLADYSLPDFSAPEALDVLLARGSDVPFLVISGSIGEERAISILKRGATDYLLKDRLARVGHAIQRAVDERQQRQLTVEAEQRLRETEERVRFALEASQVGVWETDFRTDRVRWSSVMEALHGLASGSFGGTAEAFMARIHPEDREAVAAALDRATRDRTDAVVLYRSVWPDGTIHWIRGRGRTFYDDSGRPIRAAGVGFDTTETRALEAQYRQAQKMEAVGQLAGGVAHDFNNLLTVIQGYCNMLLEEPDHPNAAQLSMILQAANRATSLTRQLLAFSRQQILELSVFDLRETLHRIVPMMRRLIGEDIEVAVHVSPDQSCHVRADSGQIEQVILNLALNARDAMPSGGKLTFEIAEVALGESYTKPRPYAVPGEYVMLAVSDTGCGMDARTVERIFEPFFTTKGKEKGTGLGLATVYGIVKQCNGYIDVYSELGHGTTFKVYLPCVPSQDVPRPAPIVAQPTAIDGSETILVVEDDDSVRALISEVLAKRGYRALMAATPSEAVRLYESRSGSGIDLLLTDVVMPEMSGRELATRLAVVNSELRVLYMSGYTDAAIVHHGVLEQGTAFIQKPFTPDSLSRKLREVLATAP